MLLITTEQNNVLTFGILLYAFYKVTNGLTDSHFTRELCLVFAGDSSAEAAIRKAMEEVKDKIVNEVKSKDDVQSTTSSNKEEESNEEPKEAVTDEGQEDEL